MRVLRVAAYLLAAGLCFVGSYGLVEVLTGAPTQAPTAALAGTLGMATLGAAWLTALVRTSVGRSAPRPRVSFIGLYAIALGGYMAWSTVVGLPRVYARLQTHGVAATATLVGCAPGVGGGRGVGCKLALDFNGAHRVWAYPQDVRQFASLPNGSRIAMLVDPEHPAIAYTAADVHQRTNAGAGPLTLVGVLLILVGAGLQAAPALRRRDLAQR